MTSMCYVHTYRHTVHTEQVVGHPGKVLFIMTPPTEATKIDGRLGSLAFSGSLAFPECGTSNLTSNGQAVHRLAIATLLCNRTF